MGSGASTTNRVFTRTELEDIIKTAFQEDGVETVNLTTLMKIANKANDEEEREKGDEKEEQEKKSTVPDIKSTTKKVVDKRGKQLTLSQQTTQRIRELFDAMDSNSDKIVKKSEFVAALAKEMSEDQATLLFEEIDVSRSGRITIAKFQQYSVVASINLMRKHFKEMDGMFSFIVHSYLIRLELITHHHPYVQTIKTDKFKKMSSRHFSCKIILPSSRTVCIFCLFFSKPTPIHTWHTRTGLWSKLDENKNGKVNFKEWKVWAEDVCARDNLDIVFGTATE